MTANSRRQALRKVLSSAECVNPAAVFDPISMRLAERLGYEMASVPGSVAAAVILGVPDIVLLTLPELVELVRRLTRYSELPLLVDGDHGYGNAMNVLRTVEELEGAGAAGLTLEDTVLPDQYKAPEAMISTGEMIGKLKAAMHARSDKSLVIVGRTNAYRTAPAEAVDRLKAYADAGVDAVMAVGVRAPAEMEALHKAVGAPIILGNVAANAPTGLIDLKALSAMGIRVAFQGWAPFTAALKATEDAMKHLKSGGSVAALADKVATDAFLNEATRRDTYAGLKKDFMS